MVAATALTAHSASAAVGPGGGSAAPLGPGRPFTGLRPFVINVADLGAVGDGRADDSSAFELAYRLAADRVVRGVGRTVIQIPAGEFLITRPYALMNGVAPLQSANGLRFSGAGKRMTTLVFRPDVGPGSYLCRNENIWANLSFERMQFRSATPGASFFSSYSTGQAQDYRFSECEWMGEWEYGLVLDGTDTNSEMRWDACRVGGRYRRAFLYSGVMGREADPNDQDQFLNYWFEDMKVEYEWGNFLEFPYGGSISCRGGSYIISGSRPQSTEEYGTTSTFFRFPVAQHHDSVQRFHAQDIRFEVRNPDVRIIDSVWKSGTIHFSDCDDTGLAFKDYSAEVRPHRYTVGPRGPLIRYDSCQLMGRHEYRTADGQVPLQTVARYDMCLLRSHPANEFVAAEGTDRPDFVSFVDCLEGADADGTPTQTAPDGPVTGGTPSETASTGQVPPASPPPAAETAPPAAGR